MELQTAKNSLLTLAAKLIINHQATEQITQCHTTLPNISNLIGQDMPHFSKKLIHRQFLTGPREKKTKPKPIKLPLSIYQKSPGSRVTIGP